MSQVTEKTVTVKVKNHPRDMFYTGRQTREHLNGIMQYMSTKKTFPDYEAVKQFLGSVHVDDFVGVEHTTYKIESVDHATLTVEAITQNNERHHLGTEDISFALGIGYCEILYRDGKPYGIETEKQVKIKIVDHSKQSDESK